MNGIHEGPGRLGRADADGVLDRQPTSAIDDLAAQIGKAAAARATGAGSLEVREISTITSRAELRESALAELALRQPAASRLAELPAGMTQKWADLDAAEFARMRSPEKREAAMEAIAATLRQVPEYASDMAQRSPAIARAAGRYNEDLAQLQGDHERKRQQPEVVSQDGAKAGDKAVESTQVERLTIDADTLARLATIRAQQSREAAHALAADRDIASTVAEAAELRMSQASTQAAARDSASQARQEAIQSATFAMVARRRAEDSRAAAEALGLIPEVAPARTANVDPARTAASAPRATDTPDSSRSSTDASRDDSKPLLRRPVREDEVPDEIRRRYLVTTEKPGLIDKGRTDFTFRGGQRDGQVAFADAGKQLTTKGGDRDVIRSMVVLAQAKGWNEVTVSGTEEFRRAAWMEARLAGLQAHGYEVREADRKRLAELEAERSPTNAITVAGREQKPPSRDEPNLEALRARLVLELANPKPDREERQKLGEAGDASTQQAIRADGELRSERDMQTIRSMNAAQLKDLARMVDAAPIAERERGIRAVLDGAARHEPVHAERIAAPSSKAPTDKGVHVDGDGLSPKERKVMEGISELLKGRGYGSEFVDATMAEVESRMRSQRVHVGELVEHGAAHYQGDRTKDMSYFVTLKTAGGVETVWGKRLGAAIQEGGVKEGDQIVLINTGKKPVDVTERTLGEDGQVTARSKAAQRNNWSARAIDRLTTLDREEVGSRAGREPALRVADPQVERPAEHRAPERSLDAQATRHLGLGRDHGPER